MINLKFLNEALGKISSDEFAVLYLIANTLSLKKEGRTRIYREQIADKLGWLDEKRPEYALKKVTRLTNSLVEKGWLLKEEVFISAQKSVNFYRLSTQKNVQNFTPSTQKNVQNFTPSTQKNVPLNNSEKDVIKRKRNIKENKKKNDEINEEKEDLKTVCDSTEVKKEFKTICEINLEDEKPTVDDFDYTSMNEDFLKDVENSIDKTLIPTEVERKKTFTTKCYT